MEVKRAGPCCSLARLPTGWMSAGGGPARSDNVCSVPYGEKKGSTTVWSSSPIADVHVNDGSRQMNLSGASLYRRSRSTR